MVSWWPLAVGALDYRGIGGGLAGSGGRRRQVGVRAGGARLRHGGGEREVSADPHAWLCRAATDRRASERKERGPHQRGAPSRCRHCRWVGGMQIVSLASPAGVPTHPLQPNLPSRHWSSQSVLLPSGGAAFMAAICDKTGGIAAWLPTICDERQRQRQRGSSPSGGCAPLSAWQRSVHKRGALLSLRSLSAIFGALRYYPSQGHQVGT